MIHSFSCKNFYSFQDKTVVDFRVNNKAPKSKTYFQNGNNRLSKIEVVIGANASGKTNLLKILPFFRWMIIDSVRSKNEQLIPFKPFAFTNNKESESISEMAVCFTVEKREYTYELHVNRNRITFESLSCKDQSANRSKPKPLFSRVWDSKTHEYVFTDKAFNLPEGFKTSLRANSTTISTALILNHSESKEIAKFWENMQTNVVEAGWMGDQTLGNTSQEMGRAFDFYHKNPEIKTKAEKLLSHFDLGLEGLDITRKKSGENEVIFNVQVSHLIDGQKHYLTLPYESSGTKQLFILLKSILQVIATGGVAVLDEIDVNLHPEIVSALLDLIIQPETNPKNAQILLSTHNHIVLSKLDKYQIILVEKQKNGASKAWRLDEVQGVRADDNYFSKYIAGTYGATPNI